MNKIISWEITEDGTLKVFYGDYQFANIPKELYKREDIKEFLRAYLLGMGYEEQEDGTLEKSSKL